MAARLQMVKQLVSCGELVVTGHTAEVHFLLEVEKGNTWFNNKTIDHCLTVSAFSKYSNEVL